MFKCRKKPVEFDAIEWNGENSSEIFDFMGVSTEEEKESDMVIYSLTGNCFFIKKEYQKNEHHNFKVAIGDLIIKDNSGEFHGCTHESFNDEYEKVIY